MRHQKAGRKFGRNTSHRRAMFRNLAGNLVLHERIETTEAKAKELRRIAERLISLGVRLGDNLEADVGKLKEDVRGDVVSKRVHAQREAARFLPKHLVKTHADGSEEEVDIVYKLFHEIAPRYVERAKDGKGGGYTRVIKKVRRKGDNAPMAIIELVGSEHLAAKPAKDEPEPAEEARDDAAATDE